MADYYHWEPGSVAPLGTFDLPERCKGQPITAVPKACHNLPSAAQREDTVRRLRATRPANLRPRAVLLGGLVLSTLAVLQVACSGAPRPGGPAPAALRYVQDPSFPWAPGFAFGQVSWVTFDAARRNLLVLQRSTPPVTFWEPVGKLLGQWTTNQLGYPHSLTLHTDGGGSSSVWITDMAPPQLAGIGFGHCVKSFTLGGDLVGTIGTCGENSQGTGLDPVQFDKVTDIAFGPEDIRFITDGDLDGLNNRTLTLGPAQKVLADWSAPDNQPGSGPKEFDLPHDVEVDDCQRVWVVDALNHRVQVITAEGEFLGQLACFGETPAYGLALVRLSQQLTRVWITTNSTGASSGMVSIFDIPSACGAPPVLECDSLVASFEVTLPTTGETSLLHSIAVDPATQDVYLALLGGTLPPQRWIRQR